MLTPQEVTIEPISTRRFESVLSTAEFTAAMETGAAMRERMQGRVFWNVNTTAVGGGVAEMLQSLLRYSRGLGIDTRWVVIAGNPEFFQLTKRLHHALHGAKGDGSALDDDARSIYERVLLENSREICARVRRGDVVLLHDPQTAGLAPLLQQIGAHVIWRCHIGTDEPNAQVEYGWNFLAPYLDDVPNFVFSRESYIPDSYDHGKATIIQPSIDAFSPKNCDLDPATVRTVLVHTGLVEGPPPDPPQHTFLREDGTPGRVERRADIVRLGRAPTWETPLVVQVSRWDPLKDPVGVIRGFARLCDRYPIRKAHLVLAGPNVTGVADDPEGGDVFATVLATWRSLPHATRDRIHLASLPTDDVAENAVIVNALQRHATVVVQKSLREGFGLTVTEAMWKARPVVASAVGGIRDQIEDGKSGYLLADPSDLDAFAEIVHEVLDDPGDAARVGEAARERVRERFLGVRHLLQYAKLLEAIDA
jgi:trehalose synthase